MSAESLQDSLEREGVQIAKGLAREWALQLGRKPSRREMAAFLTGVISALRFTGTI